MSELRVPLGDTAVVALRSEAAEILAYWEFLFAGWVLGDEGSSPADITLTFHLVDELPELPAAEPVFIDNASFQERDFGNLMIYAGDTADSLLLYFRGGGVVEVSLNEPLCAEGYVTPFMVSSSRFEDALFTSLAPLLRRRDLYVIHSFGASFNGEGALIVGPSGSGKTTTGLRLILDDWLLLSNDGVAFGPRPNGVCGFPTPGLISIRRQSLGLLPELAQYVDNERFTHGHDKVFLPAQRLAQDRWSSAVPLTRIYFPRIEDQEACALVPLHKAIGLALLMEESVDRWDTAVLDEHIAVLEQMIAQAELYTLQLGRDISTLSELLRSN